MDIKELKNLILKGKVLSPKIFDTVLSRIDKAERSKYINELLKSEAKQKPEQTSTSKEVKTNKRGIEITITKVSSDD